jgi:hypothetical protein
MPQHSSAIIKLVYRPYQQAMSVADTANMPLTLAHFNMVAREYISANIPAGKEATSWAMPMTAVM